MIEACFHGGGNIRLRDRDYDGGMATSIDQKNFVKTALRLPPELHAAVHESAQKNGRSYNAELVERIQGSFEELVSKDGVNLLLGLQYDLAASQTNLHMARLRLTELANAVIGLHDRMGRLSKEDLQADISVLKVTAEHFLKRHRSDFAQLQEAYSAAEEAAQGLAKLFADAEQSEADIAEGMLTELRSGKPRKPKP